MTAPSSLPDDELVRLASSGQRDAFAVLYHRYVRQVHALVATGSPDATAAEATTVAVFSDLLRHLGEVEPGQVPGVLEHHATRRIRGHTARAHPAPLTVGGLDRMWRELDRRWPTGDAPPRDVGTMVPVTAGALVAVLVLGALASGSRRSGVPDPDRSFEAAAIQDEVTPGFLPGLPDPRMTLADEGEPEPESTIVMPTSEPEAEPTSDAVTTEPSEEPTVPEPEPTEEPDAAPAVTIRSPSDGSTRMSEGEDESGSYAVVTLDGVAVDDRDPADSLTYAWTSDLDGPLADAPTGTARLHVPDGQLTARHLLTFSATDTAGNTATATVSVVVTRV